MVYFELMCRKETTHSLTHSLTQYRGKDYAGNT